MDKDLHNVCVLKTIKPIEQYSNAKLFNGRVANLTIVQSLVFSWSKHHKNYCLSRFRFFVHDFSYCRTTAIFYRKGFIVVVKSTY